MELTVHERHDDITHIALTGRLDATEVEQIGSRLSDVTASRKRPTIIELTGVAYMSSLGIGLLVASAKKVKNAGHKLVLLSPQTMVEEILKSSRMNKVMPIARDLDEALRLLHEVGGTTGSVVPQPEVIPAAPAPRPESQVSAASDNVLKLQIKNEIPALKALYADVARFLEEHRIPYRPGYAVNLVIEELVVNIIHYAHLDDDVHLIDIELAIADGQVIVRIQDDGHPFDPRESPVDQTDLDLDGIEPGGLGLLLVLDMVDVLTYQRADNKNKVEVRIHYRA